MLKKLSLTLLCATTLHLAHAETCPTVAELKNNNLRGWEIYDSNNGSPLSPEQWQDFKHNAQQFLMAEYAYGAPEGPSHCYYGNQKGEYMDAFLARHSFHPGGTCAWREVDGFTRCYSNIEACIFEEGRWDNNNNR